MPRAFLTLVLAVLLSACGDESSPPVQGWSRLDPAHLTEAQQAQQEQGMAAKQALFERLSKRLKAGLEDGPAEAIAACREAAPEIAAAVTAEQGLGIGRTSFKLRNPANTPPAWAADYVEQHVEEPVWLAHADGRLAGLLPIKTQTMCLTCHGGEAKIPEPIRSALAELYPEDRATGFTAGTLRGWFWLEIPAP